MHVNPTLTLVALAAVLLGVHAPVRAQSTTPRPTPRITLAIVDSLPITTARALVVRRAEGPILLAIDRRHATTETLGLGLAMIDKLSQQPIAAGEQHVVPIQGGVATRPPSNRRLSFLRAQLTAVNARKTQQLGALGRGQFVDIADPGAR